MINFLISFTLFSALALCETIHIPFKLHGKDMISHRDPTKRVSHYPVITGDSFRALANHVLDETSPTFETNEIQDGDIVFVGMPYISYFVREISPHITSSYILITSNGGGKIDNQFLPFLSTQNLIAWFGRNMTVQHKKAHIIPLGLNWRRSRSSIKHTEKYLANVSTENYFTDKPIHTLWAGVSAKTSPTRPQILKKIKARDFVTTSAKIPFFEYLEKLRSSKFVLSPRGRNIDCYRTWEALYVGSIPVVESHGINDVYKDLPVVIVENLSDVTKELLESEFESLMKKRFNLEKLHMDYWIEKIHLTQAKYIEKLNHR